MGIITSLLIFSFVIFIHELGHFLVGLKLGASPKEFSIGFGKALFQKEIRGVNFKLGGIPFGGYVRFEKDANHINADCRISHGRGILVYLAGPFFNLMLSYLMILFLVLFIGNSPSTTKQSKLVNEINSLSEQRSNLVFDSVSVTNKLIKKGSIFFIKTLKENWKADSIVNDTTGPIGISSQIHETYEKGSFIHLYLFTILLSISLGITNLIPLGVLDGGKVMSSVLKVTLSEKLVSPFLAWYDRISLAFLLALAAVVTVKDFFELLVKLTISK